MFLLLCTLVGCSNIFSNLPGGSGSIDFPPQNDSFPAIMQELPEAVFGFMHKYRMAGAGLAGLLALWFISKFYRAQKHRPGWQMGREDMALFRLVRKNMDRIWENYRRGKGVIKLDDWRE